MLQLETSLSEARDSIEALAFAARLAEVKARPRLRMHAFHRWYGKLVPAIPATAVELFTRPGELVLDPFCGSGTTLLEARVAGRAAEGCDVNPLATLLSRVKTRVLEPERLERAAADLLARFRLGGASDWRERLPGIANREHFHPDPVAKDLLGLFDAVAEEPDLPLREWQLALASAINRDVSNADTRHVFPGVSKRMRAMIAEGWRGDVGARLTRALKSRLSWSRELHESALGPAPVSVHEGPVAALQGPCGRAALLVTNPPYLSSIRWVDTFKLEAWWAGMVRSLDELHALDRAMLGTERIEERASLSEAELEELPSESARQAVLALLAAGEPRRARVVERFVRGLEDSLAPASRALRSGGRAIVKIAPSRLKSVSVPTPEICVEILQRQGLELTGVVEDRYAPGSRTLTTARNWYSGRMDADAILLLEKG